MKKLKTKTMKNLLFYTLIFCSFIILSCEKNSVDSLLEKDGKEKAQCVAVSYLTGICKEAVLKIEDPAFYTLGEEWNGHENAFFTVLGCEMDETSLKGKIFKVSISTKDVSDRNCVVCQATLDYTGNKKYFVTLCE